MMKPEVKPLRVAAILPAYREAGRIGEVVRAVRAQGVDAVVIDDGSGDGTDKEAQEAGAMVVRHGTNKGKGVALSTGFSYAQSAGYDVVITMDSDGQHDPAEIPRFVEAYDRTKIPVLVGNRMADLSTMPLVRQWTNLFMSRLLGNMMGQYMPDSQCGYRLYRCDLLPLVSTASAGFAAESEVLLRLADRGIRMDSVRIRTIYGTEKSKINPVRDTVRFFHMLWKYRRERTSRKNRLQELLKE
jgi:glycosyltransferase involved in cell wall biosynthesis